MAVKCLICHFSVTKRFAKKYWQKSTMAFFKRTIFGGGKTVYKNVWLCEGCTTPPPRVRDYAAECVAVADSYAAGQRRIEEYRSAQRVSKMTGAPMEAVVDEFERTFEAHKGWMSREEFDKMLKDLK